MKTSRRSVFRPFLQPLIPISLERRHVPARRNIKPQLAPKWIPLIAAADDFLRFNAARMLNFQRPENPVQHMAAHIAERAVPKIIPAVPLMRMQVRVKVAIRRWANPIIPMHPFRSRLDRRPRAFAAIGAIGPAMRLLDVTHHLRRHKLAEPMITLHTMA